MRALTVQPGTAGTTAIDDMPDPTPADDQLLVEGLAIGVCGTDREIIAGNYGWAPPGRDRLVLGHESLGRVRHAPPGSDLHDGDLIVGVVRRPDPVPCGACAHGEFDMCRNGHYTERGIKEIDGYGAQLWTVEPDYAVRLDPRLAEVGMLMEPTTVVAKAWEQVDTIGNRTRPGGDCAVAGDAGIVAAVVGPVGLEVAVGVLGDRRHFFDGVRNIPHSRRDVVHLPDRRRIAIGDAIADVGDAAGGWTHRSGTPAIADRQHARLGSARPVAKRDTARSSRPGVRVETGGHRTLGMRLGTLAHRRAAQAHRLGSTAERGRG
jgi:hypothetical protein